MKPQLVPPSSVAEQFDIREFPPVSDWPEPKPLPNGLAKAEAFDAEFLPTKVAPWVSDIAERLQCPADYVAVAGMTALGAVIGRRAGIKPQERTDWVEVPNLWGLFVDRPGMLKSPAMNEAMKPLHELEHEAAKENEIALKAYQAGLDAYKLREKVHASLTKEALKKSKGEREINVKFDVGAEPQQPLPLRYKTTQPSRIAAYVRRANADGGGDGLIQRFGLMVWPDNPAAWENIDRYPNAAARETVRQIFAELAKLTEVEALKRGANKSAYDKIPCFRFDDAARAEFLDWRQDLERRLRSGALSPALEGHLAKYRKLVPALALINHLADGGNGDVPQAAVLKALAFATYLETMRAGCTAPPPRLS